ncbi:MAG TPA: Rieske 2Fe-2S domain-containing protein, partial [Chloroflexota bacterium]|nr:Rieske 2Fe-2S domain-containing protein [Chloroflexota bacterium]
MLTKNENERFTQIGPGTPAGALLRRYWQPACIASELTEEHPKKRVRILGEDVVVFRLPAEPGEDRLRYGCLAEHCAHRGTSLYYGFLEQDGLRCAYHGWKYAPDGRCLEQPFESSPAFKERICQVAYPVEKLGGLLFVYMGPPDKRPLLPRWDVLVREDGERYIEQHPVLDCNWLQPMENTVDPAHLFWLHGHTMRLRGSHAGDIYHRPVKGFYWDVCEWGIMKLEVYDEGHVALDVMPPLVFPNILRICQHIDEAIHFRLPIDDSHTQIFCVILKPAAQKIPQPEDPPVVKLVHKDEEGEFLLDTFPSQDAMAWETQGAVANRPGEHLGSSDR